MKKFKQSVLGVTLLEIMLVLAIAAMIIVMSVRYYQSASSSQQATAALSMIQGITAAADQLAQGGQGYNGVSQTGVQNIMNGGNPLLSPWGTPVTVTGESATKYKVQIENTSVAVCTALTSQLAANSKFTNISACGSGGAAANFEYTYDSTAGGA